MQRTPPEMCQVRCIHGADVARARALMLDDGAYAAVAELFGALADATRAKIVHALLQQELCTCDIAALVGISESGVSQHLRMLRNLRLVKFRRGGKLVYYSLDDAHIALLVRTGLTHQGDHAPAPLGQPAPATA
ncbi:MAG: ArsR/SmtB family transcription factor [Chloroflexota bacterium]